MNIFSEIVSKIFPANHPAMASELAAPLSPMATPPPIASTAPVDVESMLSGLAAKNPETLNWRTSIVDLMKLLGLDSSLAARKQLAQELGYNGDKNDSASMNVWLSKQVMTKLSENGGKVPEALLH